MKATHWIKNNPNKSKEKDKYQKAFDLLQIKNDNTKKNFRTLDMAMTENDQNTVDEVLNYFKENTSREITAEEIDKLKFIAEVSERGPEAMMHHQLYEQYFPKELDFDHVKKVPTYIFNWRDSQGVIRNQQSDYKKSSNDPKNKGLCGKLSLRGE